MSAEVLAATSRLTSEPETNDREQASIRDIRQMFLAGGCPRDAEFDQHMTPEVRRFSGWFWTPVEVAQLAALWLEEFGARSVLDVGSGAGKFCVVAALATPLSVLGLEQRPNLVSAARSLASRFGVESRVAFLQGSLGFITLPRVDAYYFFNPFGENLFGASECLDEAVELTRERFHADFARTQAMLEAAPTGTLVVTYNGIGGRMPESYVLRRVEDELPCNLKLFEKTGYSTRLFTPRSEWPTSPPPSM